MEQIRQAVRRALDNLVDLAVDRRVAFVLIAGDIYDGTWDDHNTGLHFVKWLSRLHEHGICVFAISGNHDAESKMTKFLQLPPNPNGMPVMLSAQTPETILLDELGVAIHGRGFPTPKLDHNIVVDYPAAVPGMFNIGMLHTSLAGAEGHDTYAPCSIADLNERDYQYWALGHVHTRKHHHQPGQTPIVFPGNVQGRHIRETGVKGCEVVTVDDTGNVSLQFESLDVLRWQVCEVDATGVETPEALPECFSESLQSLVGDADGLPLAVRVIVSGATTAHEQWLADPFHWTQQIRAAAITAGSDVWIEKVRFVTRPAREFTGEELESGPIGQLLGLFDELQHDDGALDEVFESLKDLQAKIPAELGSGDDAITPADPAARRQLLQDVQPMLLQRLLTSEVTR